MTVPHTRRSMLSPAATCAAIAFTTGSDSSMPPNRPSGPSTRAKGLRKPLTSQRVIGFSWRAERSCSCRSRPYRNAALGTRASFPSRACVAATAVLALEAFAVARELALELFAPLLRRVHAPALVLVELQRRIHARDVVPPEGIRQLL